jgi:phosphoglycerate dehydrogenase-like enzyme
MGSAIRDAGGTEAPLGEADALIWYGTALDLAPMLADAPRIRWIQLPAAGVEDYLELMESTDRMWTAAKGVYADPCAEHALGLAIAGFRHLDAGVRSRSWRKFPAKTLFGATVVIVGGAGGIGQSLLRLLKPFRVKTTSVRRRNSPTPGADRTVAPGDIIGALADADLLVLAAPLTSATENMVAEPQLRAMKNDAWLVNVARGRLVKTDDLVIALAEGWIGGAGLDVTEPEPLPAEHPLWQLDNCIITSHTANPPNLDRQLYRARIVENVRRFLAGKQLIGLVDRTAGY